MSKSWKNKELRVCRDHHGERRGNVLRNWCSDCVDTPYAIEVKCVKDPSVRAAYIEQARTNAQAEDKDWLVVVGSPGTPTMTATVDYKVWLELNRKAGVL